VFRYEAKRTDDPDIMVVVVVVVAVDEVDVDVVLVAAAAVVVAAVVIDVVDVVDDVDDVDGSGAFDCVDRGDSIGAGCASGSSSISLLRCYDNNNNK
jgi:hypothetical protein